MSSFGLAIVQSWLRFPNARLTPARLATRALLLALREEGCEMSK